MDAADHVVRGLARRKLCGADGRNLRHRVDRLLLLGGRQGLAGAHATPHQPASAPPRRRHVARPRDLRSRTGDLDPGRAAADRAPTVVGPDHRRFVEDVRQAPRLVPRAGRAPHPHCVRHDVRAVAPARGDRPARNRVGGGSRCLGVPLRDRRHDVRAARTRSRDGRGGVRAGRDRRESSGSARGTRIGLRSAGSGRFSERSRSSSWPGSC